jgi:glycosyltransferase involved in cell wall biosynthesis
MGYTLAVNLGGGRGASPLVSVIVPTFNRTRFLPEALASALGQTYGPLEIIVADDASTEDVQGAVLSQFRDPRVRYERNPQNLGMGPNCWNALARASGTYVATLHDDDIWEPDFLASLVPPLEADPSLSVAFCDHHVIDEGGALDPAATDANTRHWRRDQLRPGTLRPFVEAAVIWQSVPAAMAALFRKSAIDWADFPREVGTYYDAWLAYQAARTGAGAHYEPRRLTRYRVHGQSETRSWRSSAGRLKARRQAEFVFGRYLEDPGLAAVRPAVADRYARTAVSLAAALIEDGAVDDARRVLREAHRRVPRADVKAARLFAMLPASASRGLISTARRLRGMVGAPR